MKGLLGPLLGENVELVPALGPDLGHVRADAAQMEQLILNLLVNARDAMPGGGTITITTDNVEIGEPWLQTHMGARRGPHVLLSVRDTGVGMDADTQAHIFEPFFTTKERGKGTGLGLSIVYGIVKQSRGHISVASEPGQGTTFLVHLPRVAGTLAVPERVTPTPLPRAGKETLLVVEDDPVVRAFIREALEGAGYFILDCPTPERAVDLALRYEGPIPLLLVDVLMPRLNGPEVASRIQASRPEVKVLYMSGYSHAWMSQHGVSGLGGAAFLQKPFTSDVLLHRIRELLG
jgi:CheY-like chemotaxis protein